jgi:hypothetical protein
VLEAAAANNAAWCHAFCASHGIAGRFGDDAWSSPVRTPPLYPDAVTLRSTADARAVLALVDDGPGCSVKDSFDRLELEAHGFHVLVRASWFALSEPRSRAPGWRDVANAEDLAAWERAWSGAEPTSFFRATLIEDDAIRVLARVENGAIVAGAVANRAAGVIGLTNVFGSEAWGCVGALPSDEPVVCWEAEAPPGFERLGDLTVWRRS